MIYLWLAAFLWGTSFIAGKIAYNMADPALVVMFRLIIASVVMLPFCLRRFKTVPLMSRKEWWRLALLGFLSYPVTFILQFVGLSMTSASSAATMMGTEPVMVVLMGWLVYREKASLETVFLAFLAFIGVALVVGEPGDDNVSVPGCMLVLSSTVVVGCWLRLSKHFLSKMDPTFMTAFTLGVGSLLGAPLVLLLAKDWHINYSASGTVAIVYLGIACSILASWLWNKGLEKTTANASGIFLALEPVFGVLMSVLVLGETLSLPAIIGVLLVIGSAAFVMCKPYFKSRKNRIKS